MLLPSFLKTIYTSVLNALILKIRQSFFQEYLLLFYFGRDLDLCIIEPNVIPPGRVIIFML